MYLMYWPTMTSKRWLLFFASLCWLLAGCLAASEEEAEAEAEAGEDSASVVIELNDDNFQETVKEADLILVKFHAPW